MIYASMIQIFMPTALVGEVHNYLPDLYNKSTKYFINASSFLPE